MFIGDCEKIHALREEGNVSSGPLTARENIALLTEGGSNWVVISINVALLTEGRILPSKVQTQVVSNTQSPH